MQALVLEIADLLPGGCLAKEEVLAVPAETHRVVLGLAVGAEGGHARRFKLALLCQSGAAIGSLRYNVFCCS